MIFVISMPEQVLKKNTAISLSEPEVLVKELQNMKIKEAQIEMKEREFGESYLKPLKSMEYMINMFFSIIFIRAITRKNK